MTCVFEAQKCVRITFGTSAEGECKTAGSASRAAAPVMILDLGCVPLIRTGMLSLQAANGPFRPSVSL